MIRSMGFYSLLLMGTLVFLAELLAPWLVDLFIGGNPEVLPIAKTGLRITAISLIPAILNNGFRNYYQGIQHKALPKLIALMRFLMPTMLLAFLLSRLFGLNGVWIGIVLGESITFLVISANAWKHYGKISLSAEAYCLLKELPETERQNLMELTIREKKDVVQQSEMMRVYCQEKGLGQKKAMLIGLCIEELAMNIIEYGFTEDQGSLLKNSLSRIEESSRERKISNNSHNSRDRRDSEKSRNLKIDIEIGNSIEVRLKVREDEVTLRIRDNCESFDPVRYLELHRNDDLVAHIGLRMIMGMVKTQATAIPWALTS